MDLLFFYTNGKNKKNDRKHNRYLKTYSNNSKYSLSTKSIHLADKTSKTQTREA